jgi:hypothetical protein
MSELEQIAEELRASASGLLVWAGGSGNNGPFAEEIYRTNVQIHVAFKYLADRLEAIAKQGGGS